jgi:hypothetical protein
MTRWRACLVAALLLSAPTVASAPAFYYKLGADATVELIYLISFS